MNNPLNYISKYSNNNNTLEKTKEMGLSPEVIAVIVFIAIYIIIRLIEKYISPYIPLFLFTEMKSIYSWGLILIPLIIGFSSYTCKSHIIDDKKLKERMYSFLKK